MSTNPRVEMQQKALETAKKAEESVARVVSETRGVWRQGVGKTLAGCLPRGVVAAGERARAWWTRERVHRVAETSLPNRYVDALAAEGASVLGLRFGSDLLARRMRLCVGWLTDDYFSRLGLVLGYGCGW